MKRKPIYLSESQLKRIIGQTVKKILRETYSGEKMNSDKENEWYEKALDITKNYEPDEEYFEPEGGWPIIHAYWSDIETEDGIWPEIYLQMTPDREASRIQFTAPDGTKFSDI